MLYVTENHHAFEYNLFLPVPIELGEFLPFGRNRCVAHHQMVHVIDVHVIRRKHFVQLADEIVECAGDQGVLEWLCDAGKRLGQSTKVLDGFRLDVMVVVGGRHFERPACDLLCCKIKYFLII